MVVVLLLAGVVALLPTLLSTPPGERFALGFAETMGIDEATVDSLSLSWFGGQRVEGLVLKDAAGGIITDIELLDVPDASLWSLVVGDLDLGEVALRVREVNLPLPPEMMEGEGETALPAGLAVRLDYFVERGDAGGRGAGRGAAGGDGPSGGGRARRGGPRSCRRKGAWSRRAAAGCCSPTSTRMG